MLPKLQELEDLAEEQRLKLEEKKQKKENLKAILQEQINNNMIIKRYEKEIQKEMERFMMVSGLVLDLTS
jgi:hypothetical protein